MSFLLDVLLEVLASGGWGKEPPKPSGEFILDESCASIAGFLALLGLLCCISVTLPIWAGRADGLILTALAVSGGFAVLGSVVAKRTFRVTRRGWLIARLSLWVARATLLADAVALSLAARLWVGA